MRQPVLRIPNDFVVSEMDTPAWIRKIEGTENCWQNKIPKSKSKLVLLFKKITEDFWEDHKMLEINLFK